MTTPWRDETRKPLPVRTQMRFIHEGSATASSDYDEDVARYMADYHHERYDAEVWS